MSELQVWETVVAAYRRVFVDWKNISYLVLTFAVLLTLLQLAEAFWFGDPNSVLPAGIELVCEGYFAFWTHRLILLDPPKANWKQAKATQFVVDGQKIGMGKFLLLFCGLALLIILPGIIVMALTYSDDPAMMNETGMILGFVAIIFLFSILFTRISFAFPALAIQKKSGPIQAWFETRGIGLKLYAIYACQIVPFVSVGSAIAYIGYLLGSDYAMAVFTVTVLVLYVLKFIGIAVLVAMISLSYKTAMRPAELA